MVCFKTQLEFRKSLFAIFKDNYIDMIIPSGDHDISFLDQILSTKFNIYKPLKLIKQAIYRSFNNKSAFKILGNKSNFQNYISQMGLLGPNNKIINSKNEIIENIVNRKFPIVLKLDYGVAGSTVRICKSEEEAKNDILNLRKFSRNYTFFRKVTNSIKVLLVLPVYAKPQKISIQNYIDGINCFHSIFASKGKVLSSCTLQVLASYPNKTGPSSVVKVIKHEQIDNDIRKLVQKLDLSGFACFDYIIDNNSIPYLLECNLRPTSVTHLSNLCGANLVESLKTHLEIEESVEGYPDVKEQIIALFPNEIKRNPNSEFIKNNFHDIPVDDENLKEFLLKND